MDCPGVFFRINQSRKFLTVGFQAEDGTGAVQILHRNMLLIIGLLGLANEVPDSVGAVQHSVGGGTDVAGAPDMDNADSGDEGSSREDEMVELIAVGDTAPDPILM